MGQLANILIYADIHLTPNNYGAHRNYYKESLEYFEEITKKAEELEITHLIGLGDLSYHRFKSLEYRTKVEELLKRQYNLTKGNRWELKGNHDSATYGMTEYEFYVQKGLIRPSENIKIGNVNISMLDYGKHNIIDIIPPNEKEINILLFHDYFKFSDTQLPNYGNAIELDHIEKWYGIDIAIGGHIHKQEKFTGFMSKNKSVEESKRVLVLYPGSPCRPAYREGHMDEEGMLIMIRISEELDVDFQEVKFPLWPLSKSFNLEQKMEQQNREEYKINVIDIVEKINKHERTVGNPEDIIMAMDNIDLRYREKAIQLLKEGAEN